MSVNNLLSALQGARIFDLAQPIEAKMPVSPNHPGFKMALQRRHGDMVRADGGSAANEMMNLCRGLGLGRYDFVIAHEAYRRLGGQST